MITVGSPAQHAYVCDVECGELAAAVTASEELLAIRREPLKEDAPDSKSGPSAFEPMEKKKKVLLDPEGDKTKTVEVGSSLTPK